MDDSNEEQPGEELSDGEGTPPEEETPAVEEPAAGSEEPAEEEPSEEPDPAETPLAEDPTSDVTVSEGEEVIEQEEEKDEEETEPEEEKIEEDPICEKAYINLQNRFGVTLPVFLSTNSWFGVSDSGYNLYFRMTGIQECESVLEKESDPPEDPLQKALFVHYNSTVLYSDALPGAELKYDVCGQSLKETITFPELGIVPEQVSYEIFAEGMTAELTEDGEVHFFAEGEEVFRFQAPFLMDSEGVSSDSLPVELEDLGEGCFILRCTLDREWLESEERVWPVMLDPTISNESATGYYRDTFVCHTYPNANYGTSKSLYVGSLGGQNAERRILINHEQFPILDSGDVIMQAQLTAYGRLAPADAPPILVEAHAVTTQWNSLNVLWGGQPNRESEVLDFQIVSAPTSKTYTWDVTSAVQRWYNGSASSKGSLPRYGFMLTSPQENSLSTVEAIFASSDGNAFECWPKLLIYYRNTSGLESYWDYTSAGAGRAGTVYASNATGNLVVSRCDMSYSGNRMPADIVFTYNQNDCTKDIGYGKGWRSSYSQQIESKYIGGKNYYKWTDGDGTQIYFGYDDDEAKWLDENTRSYELSIDASGYTISDRDDNRLAFDANGRLISMTDKLSNSLSISYAESGTTNLRISQVTDGAGRVYDFNYSNDVLSSVVYKGAGSTAIETVSYTYSSDALTSVTYADGKSAGYTYNNNALEEARDILRGNGTCNKLHIDYAGSPARVILAAPKGANTVWHLRGAFYFTFVQSPLPVTCLHLFYLFLLFLRFLCYSFLAFQTCFLFGWPPFYALCCC